MIKAVLFDLDNTLIDFMRIKKASVNAAINAMLKAGLKMSRKEAHRKLYEMYWRIGIEHQKIFQNFLTKMLGRIDYRILAAGIVAYRKAQSEVLKPYTNVVPTLKNLKRQGIKLAIISDAPRLKAWIRLTEIELQDYFDVVVAYDDTKQYKPHKAPFLAALKQLKIAPENCLMVGDRPERDIQGAKELGMKTAFAKYGAAKDLKSQADYELGSIEEVLIVVK
ncbi:TIGR02253 family HAD-type hydrolase [Candidatus Woesearchaeota archaeon]|nr:TIGR02253 family HAD-type hydrolase [Candidatus Woesearchaeota archaeon]